MMNLPSPWDQAYEGALTILNAIYSARDQAALLLGGPPPPDPELDYNCPPLAGNPLLLLGYLAELWVISDPKDKRSEVIGRGLERLAAVRKRPPVQIGGA